LKTIASVKKADLKDLEIVLGSGVARALKEHLGEKAKALEKPGAEELEQKSLEGF